MNRFPIVNDHLTVIGFVEFAEDGTCLYFDLAGEPVGTEDEGLDALVAGDRDAA